MIEYKHSSGNDLRSAIKGEQTAVVAAIDGWEVATLEIGDATLREWARWCALQVAHLLPKGCSPLVRRWLETGDGAAMGRAADAARVAGDAAAGGRHSAAVTAWAAWAAEEAAGGSPSKAAAWAAQAAGGAAWAAWAAPDVGTEVEDAARGAQHSRLAALLWRDHGLNLTTRERIELARDLRYRGEEEAAAAVLPPELKEVPA